MIQIIENKLYIYCKELNIPIQSLSILLSLSGGIDSMVLASVLIELSNKHFFKLQLMHFNHNVHQQAGQIERFCKLFAQENDINIYCTNFSFEIKTNFEACARSKRYSELNKLANELDVHVVLTAHHLDDQIETLYMKMLDRSDWISGIGIRNNWGKIRRPLLDTQKEFIKQTANDRKLTWIEDPTNDDISIRRNNVRKFLLPNALKDHPEMIYELLANANANKLKMEMIISNLNENRKQLIKYDSEKFLSIDLENIKNFKIENLKIFLYWCSSNYFKIAIPQLSRKYWIEFSNYIKHSQTGSKFNIGSLTSIINRNELHLISNYSDFVTEPDKMQLIQNQKWYDSHFHIIEQHNAFYSVNKNKFSISFNLFKKGLFMRRWKKGDKMLSAALKKHILISDLFVNNKLSIFRKLIQPIIVDKMDQIVWIPGLAYAEIQQETIEDKIKVIEWIPA